MRIHYRDGVNGGLKDPNAARTEARKSTLVVLLKLAAFAGTHCLDRPTTQLINLRDR